MPPKSITKKCPKCCGTGRVIDPVLMGAQLRDTRISRKLTLRSVAAAMGKSAAYISDLENGNRGWPMATMLAYEKAVGL